MHAILDHLTAILVGATLLGALLFVQMRQQQTSIETVQRDRAYTHASSFFSTLEREVENARTRDQSQTGLGYYVVEVDGSATHTNRFTFTTQAPPPPGAPAGTPSRMVSVSYRAIPTGETIRVGTADHPTYTVERWTNALPSVGTMAPSTYTRESVVANDVVTFLVEAYDRDNDRINWASTDAGYGRPSPTYPTDDPIRFQITLEGAAESPDRLAGDQRATSDLNLASFGQSIKPVNAGASGAVTVPGVVADYREVPLLPGEPSPPAPPPGTGGSGGGGGTDDGGGGSSPPPPPPPPAPTRPTPPPGVQV